MNKFWPNYKDRPIIFALLVLLFVSVIITLIAIARNEFKQNYYIGKSAETERLITITGEGKVTAIPDIATVTLGLETEKYTVTEAQKENSQIMNNLINRLQTLNIAKQDIKTANYWINPRYDWVEGKRILRGYVVSQNVTVKIREIEKVEQVLAIAGDLNLNQIGGLTFDVDKPEVYRQEARKKALENAKEKAEELADIMGVELGKVVSFNENTDAMPQPVPKYAALESAEGLGGAAPTIEEGSQEIVIRATITYELD